MRTILRAENDWHIHHSPGGSGVLRIMESITPYYNIHFLYWSNIHLPQLTPTCLPINEAEKLLRILVLQGKFEPNMGQPLSYLSVREMGHLVRFVQGLRMATQNIPYSRRAGRRATHGDD
jgi:hypothetical protein